MHLCHSEAYLHTIQYCHIIKSQGGLSEKLRKLNWAPHTRKSLVKGERFMRYVWRAWDTRKHVKFDLVWLMYQNQGLKIWINALCWQQAFTQLLLMFCLLYFDMIISILSCNAIIHFKLKLATAPSIWYQIIFDRHNNKPNLNKSVLHRYLIKSFMKWIGRIILNLFNIQLKF